ncbi:unnamed protein product [Cuscuta campestris]|uniref:DUF223 domain-containing protein n=1 Tax=Cuscuta campestris TaxID=132261 RepID=A0A484N6Y0_9ASTE|nr:unnamed protein product [Cuscuta campestris]
MDAEEQIIHIKPNSRSWSCKVLVIEKLNERESFNKPGLTYKPIILQDSAGHKVKAMTYGQDIAVIDKRIQLNGTYKVFDARVSPAAHGFAVPDETYRFIWTLNRRTMIHDVSPDEKLVPQPTADAEIEPFSMFYKSMWSKKDINVLGAVISKLARMFVFTKKGQKTTTDFIIIDQECKPITLTLWEEFATTQGIEIEKALESGTYPTILAKRILATTYQGLTLTTRQDSSIELNPTIPLAASLEEW